MAKHSGIPIKNIYHMLAYAFTNLIQREDRRIAGENFENQQDMFAAVLALCLGNQRKQGMYREYVNRTEALATLRGRIDIQSTIRNRLARKKLLTCEFDEFSEDNLINRILKITALLLLRSGNVSQRNKDALKREMLFFSDVGQIDPTSIRWSAIRFQRRSLTCRTAVTVCRFILEGMLLTDDSGNYRLASFIDAQRMSTLYEKFILAYYQREHMEVKAETHEIEWILDDGISALLPRMRSDIMLSKGNKVLIIDAKFYRQITQTWHDTATVRSDHLYQIFTYVKNRDLYDAGEKFPHTVSGMLLYATTDEEIQPDISYRMSGNRISVRTLNLNMDFSEIRKQLDNIVNEYFGRC